jgi:hypothetical protein
MSASLRSRPNFRTAANRRGVADSDICQIYSITSSARASSVGGMSRPSARAALRLITNSNLVVRGRSGPTQKRRTSLGRAGSGCAPFATSWDQRQAVEVALSPLS